MEAGHFPKAQRHLLVISPTYLRKCYAVIELTDSQAERNHENGKDCATHFVDEEGILLKCGDGSMDNFSKVKGRYYISS